VISTGTASQCQYAMRKRETAQAIDSVPGQLDPAHSESAGMTSMRNAAKIKNAKKDSAVIRTCRLINLELLVILPCSLTFDLRTIAREHRAHRKELPVVAMLPGRTVRDLADTR